MSYIAFNGIIYVNFGQLNEACNFNIYEFRILSSTSYDVQFLCTNCTIVDLDNISRTGTAIISSSKKYCKFQYIYQFSGESIIHTYYQLN